MNSEFAAACAYYAKPLVLSHQQQVVRLYRAALKTAFSWASDRELFLKDATAIRAEFRKNASLDPESQEAKQLLADGQKKLQEHIHPDKYILCYPHGIPKEVAESIIPVHPDQIPYTWRPNNEEILIDFNGKKMI
ncbi:hypothetical protein WA158_000352 [Blastocystis sp. Blastoise]